MPSRALYLPDPATGSEAFKQRAAVVVCLNYGSAVGHRYRQPARL